VPRFDRARHLPSTAARALRRIGESAIDKTVIKLAPDVGRALKAHCALQGQTMAEFVTRLVWQALPPDDRQPIDKRDPGSGTYEGLERRRPRGVRTRSHKPRRK
jgi:hypothetical protein